MLLPIQKNSSTMVDRAAGLLFSLVLSLSSSEENAPLTRGAGTSLVAAPLVQMRVEDTGPIEKKLFFLYVFIRTDIAVFQSLSDNPFNPFVQSKSRISIWKIKILYYHQKLGPTFLKLKKKIFSAHQELVNKLVILRLQHPFKMGPSQNIERSGVTLCSFVSLFLPSANREAAGGNNTDGNWATCVGQLQIPNPWQ